MYILINALHESIQENLCKAYQIFIYTCYIMQHTFIWQPKHGTWNIEIEFKKDSPYLVQAEKHKIDFHLMTSWKYSRIAFKNHRLKSNSTFLNMIKNKMMLNFNMLCPRV